MLPTANWCSSSENTSVMTAFRSTSHPLADVVPGRDRFSRPLTILAARNVCRSIFSSRTRSRICRIGALEQHLREARDAGQRRVHLVGDAGSQQADRRHLLGDLQLLLEPNTVGDVLDEQDRPDDGVVVRRTVLQRHRGGVDEQPLRRDRCCRDRASAARDSSVAPVRMLVPRRPQRFDERRVEHIGERAGRSPSSRDTP